ncbi:hypothetical protein SSX86_029168 [Deinandra increscens subsp. villosa]|uniref:Uncharacterized protein n=1 Tax=Deinandra increscens subsp. villosa TaxID=3103831 RepID=A0AAP0CFV7_9ASTR
MSPQATVFIKPPPTLSHHPKFNNFLYKTWLFSCPSFCTKELSAITHTKSLIFKKTMASVSMDRRFISCGDGDKSTISPMISAFEQEALINNGGVSHLHTLFNRLSKWVVGVTFGGFMIILRHDDLALWAAVGSISNYILSITLKRILKQDRPASEVSTSGPGMPSSHAQTVFFTLVFVIMSVIETMGLNGATSIFGILLVALGSYLVIMATDFTRLSH